MTDFNPGEGWREVDISDENTAVYELARYGDDGELIAGWVREEPVPPLPTEPYTVIRVTWSSGFGNSSEASRELTLHLNSGNEYEWVGWDDQYYDTNLAGYITGFEVLSEPRAVTVKAVLKRVRDYSPPDWHPNLADIAREFGV